MFMFLNAMQETAQSRPLNQHQQFHKKLDEIRESLSKIEEALNKIATELQEIGRKLGEIERSLQVLQERLSIGAKQKCILAMVTQHKALLEPMVKDLLSWEEFEKFLTLHDKGKGLVDRTLSPYNQRASELMSSRRFLKTQLRSDHKINESKIKIMSRLLHTNAIEDYLSGLLPCNAAYHLILRDAIRAGVDPCQFFSLLTAFHKVSADLDSNFEYIGDAKQKMDELQNLFADAMYDVATNLIDFKGENTTYDAILFANLKYLRGYLVQEHTRMLLTNNKPESLKVLNAYRDVLLRCIQNLLQNKKQNLLSQKVEGDEGDWRKKRIDEDIKSFEQLILDPSSIRMNDASMDMVFARCGMEDKQRWEFQELCEAFRKFRRDYLVRFCLTEPLLPVTWLHGANSGLLPGLSITDDTLIPTGMLLKLGIVPFSGELGPGCTGTGINQECLSGVSLSHTHTPLRHAQGFVVGPGLNGTIYRINEFTFKSSFGETKTITEWRDFHQRGQKFFSVTIAIKRLRILSLSEFEGKRAEIEEAHDRITKEVAEFQKTDEFKKYMPKDADPTSELGYEYPAGDCYFKNQFDNVVQGLKDIMDAMIVPVVSLPRIQETLEKPFPIIFASSLFPTLTKGMSGEEVSLMPLKVGKDIDYIFVEKGQEKDMTQRLAHLASKKKPQVQNFEELKKASKLNKSLSATFDAFLAPLPE